MPRGVKYPLIPPSVEVTRLAEKLGQLQAANRDFQSKSWASLQLLGQPCNFRAPVWRALAPTICPTPVALAAWSAASTPATIESEVVWSPKPCATSGGYSAPSACAVCCHAAEERAQNLGQPGGGVRRGSER